MMVDDDRRREWLAKVLAVHDIRGRSLDDVLALCASVLMEHYHAQLQRDVDGLREDGVHPRTIGDLQRDAYDAFPSWLEQRIAAVRRLLCPPGGETIH